MTGFYEMSLRRCALISTILRHNNSKKLLNFQNFNICKTYGYIKSPILISPVSAFRCYSTKEKEITGSKIQEVYCGMFTAQIRGVKLCSLLPSLTGIAAQPYLYKQLLFLNNVPIVVLICSIIGFFTLVAPVLLHYISKKYVTTLTYNTETKTYTATTLNLINIPIEIEFTPDDVTVPEIPGLFTTFVAKGYPLFVEARAFKDPTHYRKLMGYDKPLDLKLFQTSQNKKDT